MRPLGWLVAPLATTACLSVAEVQPTDEQSGGTAGTSSGGTAGTSSGGTAGTASTDAGADGADAGPEADAGDSGSAQCGIPKLLDDFNRPNGAVGAKWAGQVGAFSIAGNQLAHAAGSGSQVVGLYFATPLCAAQQAFVTFAHVDASSEYTSLALKVQNDGTCDRLTVSYRSQTQSIQLWTCGGGSWKMHKEWPRQLVDGDELAASADDKGQVTVRVNGVTLGTQSVSGWPFATLGGRIGVTVWNGPGAARFDDFGGG